MIDINSTAIYCVCFKCKLFCWGGGMLLRFTIGKVPQCVYTSIQLSKTRNVCMVWKWSDSLSNISNLSSAELTVIHCDMLLKRISLSPPRTRNQCMVNVNCTNGCKEFVLFMNFDFYNHDCRMKSKFYIELNIQGWSGFKSNFMGNHIVWLTIICINGVQISSDQAAVINKFN